MILTGVLLAVATYTDLKRREIPDDIPIALLMVGLLGCMSGQRQFREWLLDAAVVLLFLLLIVLLVERCGLDGMGGGDIKLLAALSGVIGVPLLLLIIVAASIMALIYMLYRKVTKRSLLEIPMAPFFFLAYLLLI